MRNRGVIILFAIALTFVTIYQLSFTVRSYFVKQNAVEYARGDLGKETDYLDSIAGLNKNEWSFLGNTYKEVRIIKKIARRILLLFLEELLKK
jgi:SecD/SecF fusion protein